MFVHIARRLAAQGITSLRMDIAGIGDSPAHPGQSENQLYYRGSQRDIYAALDWLQQQGYGECAVVGHCAGAYLGFFAATHDSRISKLVLLNLQRFFWKRGDSLQVAMRSGFRSTSWYISNAFDFAVWRRVLQGDINVRGITKALLRRVMQRYGGVNPSANGAGGQQSRHKVLNWFRQFRERGTNVLLVYSAEDGGLDEIALHGGRNAKKIRKLPNVQFRIIEGADHNITAPSAYEAYAKILEDYLIRT
jgi:pimeloyl-ACP methyl ester carboxylesterase